jgi:hypothetical protein
MDLAPNKAWSTCLGLSRKERNDLQSYFANKSSLTMGADCIRVFRDVVDWK